MLFQEKASKHRPSIAESPAVQYLVKLPVLRPLRERPASLDAVKKSGDHFYIFFCAYLKRSTVSFRSPWSKPPCSLSRLFQPAKREPILDVNRFYQSWFFRATLLQSGTQKFLFERTGFFCSNCMMYEVENQVTTATPRPTVPAPLVLHSSAWGRAAGWSCKYPGARAHMDTCMFNVLILRIGRACLMYLYSLCDDDSLHFNHSG